MGMKYQTALFVIFIIAICGVLFSGYLSYQELYTVDGCSDQLISCGYSGFEIANLPACVYGLLMYLIVLIVSGSSLFLNSKNKLLNKKDDKKNKVTL